MDSWLRRATPLVLLLLAGLAWFEDFLPGREYLAREFGDKFVLRFVLGLLCIYVLMLVLERQQMEQLFKQVLGQFKDFHSAQGAAGQPGGPATGGVADEKARSEAVQILVAALDSEDPKVRSGALENLQRLTGQQLGADKAAWRSWMKDNL
ncbi:MAG: hypothetical protein ACYTG5_16985 [Planctomycetota bacterium]|jgi:hypothetical protein